MSESRDDQIDRRRLTLLLAAGGAGLFTGCKATDLVTGERTTGTLENLPSETRDRIAQIFEAYDAQGIHRTATDVDRASASWLAEHIRDAGAQPELLALPFERLDPIDAFVEIDGERIEGIPMFDAPPTGPEGITATLRPVGAGDGIGFAPVGPHISFSRDYFEARPTAAEQAHLAVTGGEAFGLPEGYALANAEHYADPQGPPTLQLPSQVMPRLEAAVGEQARIVISSQRVETEAINVFCTIEGSDPVQAPLVVMTPRSGWWHCASERGGGIAVWLELIRHFAATQAPRTVHFVASTGHELGHFGLDHFLEEHHDWIAGAHAWIHLGANFAAVDGTVRLQASSEELRQLATRVMDRYDAPPGIETPTDQRPLGEARNIHDGGGRFVSLLGSNGYFHHPDDRWPQAVDLERALALRHAFVDIVNELAS